MNDDAATDQSLLTAYRHGDMAAFDQLYARYRQSLYLFLLRRGHSESIAEDIFHDCWIRVIDKASDFDGEHFRAWLYTIARNLSTDYFRKAQLRVAEVLDDDYPEQAHLSTERQQLAIDCIELIKTSLGQLSMEQRDVFLLKQEAGLSLQQIADMMAVGRETIKSRIRYAMNQLKQLMADCL